MMGRNIPPKGSVPESLRRGPNQETTRRCRQLQGSIADTVDEARRARAALAYGGTPRHTLPALRETLQRVLARQDRLKAELAELGR